jgi:ADP-heptose:LPS heptosyltransferase
VNNSSPRVVIPIVAGIGNALLAVPMVRRIKRHFAASHITILARIDAMGEVFRNVREVDDVIITGKGLSGICKNISESRKRNPDVYLVPFPSNRWQYALLALTSGARRTVLHSYSVGYWKAMHFIGDRIAAIQGIHDVQQNLNLLRALGIEDVAAEPPVFEVRDEDRAAAEDLQAPIVIHAGSAQTVLAQAKRWPVESYGKLIDALAERFDSQIVLLEGPDERGVANEILPHVRQAQPIVKQLVGPLRETAAVLQRARLYVGSDSGLAHLAAAVATPAVTIFSAADPDRVCPFGYRHLVVQPPGQAPTFLYPWRATKPKLVAGSVANIRSVTVDAVMEKVMLALGRTASEQHASGNRA